MAGLINKILDDNPVVTCEQKPILALRTAQYALPVN